MAEITSSKKNGINTINLKGRIDSSNAAEVEAKIRELDTESELILDLEGLEYISSAGLRVILRLRKDHPELKLVNASTEVYEIFDMTGFTDMMTVERAYKTVSVEGCEVIGKGANGLVYRIDPDTVVKVYMNPDSLDEIRNEREVARKALVHGIPTAIAYDVVKVGNSYASMFEMLNAKSFSKLLAAHPENIDEYAKMYIDLLKLIHGTEMEEGELPDMKETALNWTRFLKGHVPEEEYEKLYSLVDGVPRDNHLIHGDYHTKNIMLQGDEVMLIDMDTLALGHPVFELASMFLAYRAFSELDHTIMEKFQGIPYEEGQQFWKKSLSLYYGTEDEAVLKEKEEKCSVIGYIRLLRRTIRRDPDSDFGKKQIECCKEHLADLSKRIDCLI